MDIEENDEIKKPDEPIEEPDLEWQDRERIEPDEIEAWQEEQKYLDEPYAPSYLEVYPEERELWKERIRQQRDFDSY